MYWVKQYDFSNMKKPIYCIGRSSGGYLAKIFFESHQNIIDKVIYICPVFNPLLRCKLKSEFYEKSIDFFGNNKPISTEIWNLNKECLLLAKNDQNISTKCFTIEQLQSAIYLGPVTHIGMIKCISDKFINIITNFFK